MLLFVAVVLTFWILFFAENFISGLKDRLQISLLILIEFQQINKLLSSPEIIRKHMFA